MAENIKQALAILCKHINLLLGCSLKPEHFRLGKFNSTDDNVVNIFWRLLNKLTIQKADYTVNDIKKHLKSLGYTVQEFHLLPEDKSSGSRELLLAFGFVLNLVLSNLIIKKVNKTPLSPSFNLKADKREFEDLHSNKQESIAADISDKCEDYLKWVVRKLELNLRMIEEYNNSNNKIYEKLNSDTRDNYSSCEVLALNNNQCGKIYLEKTERIISVLENHKKWIAKEKVFWKWMGTVLEEKEKASC